MKIKKIIIHSSMTKEGDDISLNDIEKIDMSRGLKCCGFHFVIRLDGTIEVGRSLEEIGAHTQDNNKNSIGICYIGGLDINGEPKDTRTHSQIYSLKKLVNKILHMYNLKPDNVYGHSDFSNTPCPCFDILDFRKELTNEQLY